MGRHLTFLSNGSSMIRIMLWEDKPGNCIYDELEMERSIRRLLLIVQVKVFEGLPWGSSNGT